MTESSIKTLAAAVTLQAVRDYFAYPDQQKEILKDLRSLWMETFTNGQSITIAEQLEKHPKEIKTRLRKNAKIKK